MNPEARLKKVKVSNDIMQQSSHFEEVIKSCQHLLHTNPLASGFKSYLNGRLSGDAHFFYQFGYFPPQKHLHELTKFVDPKILHKLLLAYPKLISGGKEYATPFEYHNLIMPFRDVHGNIVSILGRTLLKPEKQKELGLQKYKYSLNSHKELFMFGLDKAKNEIIKKGYVIVVEGQFDCITAHQYGIKNVVASGWANLTMHQFFKLHRYCDNIYLMMDNDQAGKRAAKRAKRNYKNYANIKSLKIPGDKKDLDEFLRTAPEMKKKLIIDWLNNLKEM